MNKVYKSFTAIFVMIAFFATAILCCCVIKNAVAGVHKAACAHCASKSTGSSSGQECCFSKASPMEIAKSVTGIIHFLPFLAFTIISFLYLKPTPKLAYSSLYQDGPPGFRRRIPLYIQQRNFRV